MKELLLLGVIVLAVWLLYKIIKSYRKRKDDVIKIYSGANGTGKSCVATQDALKDYRLSVRHWRHINKPSFIWRIITFDFLPFMKKRRMNKEEYGLNMPLLYSNYPILISENKGGKTISKDVNNDIMLLNDSIPLGSIVVIDEFSSWVNQFQYNERFSETLNDHIQKWRHYHGDFSKLYVIDQSSDNIPLQVKRRCNRVLLCSDIKHYLGFIHILRYKYIDTSEDIKTVEINETRDVDNQVKSDTDDKTSKRLLLFIKKRYDSRAFSNRYCYVNNAVKCYNAKYIKSLLKVDNVLSTPKSKGTNLNDVILSAQLKKKINEKYNNKGGNL